MPSKDALSVEHALQAFFAKYQKKSQTVLKSTTADNGSDFCD